MADPAPQSTPTPNYSFNLPLVGGDDNVWGDLLNENWSSIDTILWTVSGVANAALTPTTGDARYLRLNGGTVTGATSFPIVVSPLLSGTSGGAPPALINGPNPGDNSQTVPTTSWVNQAVSAAIGAIPAPPVPPSPSNAAPTMAGTAAPGTSALYSRGDHVHPTDTSRAAASALAGYLPLSGGTLTGPLVLAADPAAPMQAATAQYADRPRYGDNRIINGDMRIDQRNNGAASAAYINAAYTIDRWNYITTQGAGRFNVGRNLGPPGVLAPGFPYCLGFGSQSAYTPLATDTFGINQPIEADMVSDFAWGTANAQPVTLSFWAMSNQTGIFSGAIRSANPPTRSYPFSYSIPTANAWTRVAFTIPGDMAGTWAMSGNGQGVQVAFELGGGANFRAPAGAWASGNFVGATGAVSVVATNGATFYVTGVKLEIGAVATPFNRQSLAKRLADCERYFRWLPYNLQFPAALANAIFQTGLSFPGMRATPTIGANVADPNTTQAAANISATTIGPQSPYGAVLTMTATAAGPAYRTGYRCSADAEL